MWLKSHLRTSCPPASDGLAMYWLFAVYCHLAFLKYRRGWVVCFRRLRFFFFLGHAVVHPWITVKHEEKISAHWLSCSPPGRLSTQTSYEEGILAWCEEWITFFYFNPQTLAYRACLIHYIWRLSGQKQTSWGQTWIFKRSVANCGMVMPRLGPALCQSLSYSSAEVTGDFFAKMWKLRMAPT